MPLSLGFFALTLVAFLLQIIPVVGVFMMMLAAPFWSVILVNAGFVGIAIEAAIGLVPRVWLLVPALYFGGYQVAAHMSREALQAEIAAHEANRPVALAFDPARHALVVEQDANLLHDLMKGYAIPQAYLHLRDPKRKTETTSIYRVGAPETCGRLEAERSPLADLDIWYRPIGAADSSQGRLHCLFAHPGMPETAAFRVSHVQDNPNDFLLRKHSRRLTVQAPDGRKSVRTQATLEALTRFPLPIVGCYLAGHYHWECKVDFMRDRKTELGDVAGFLNGLPANTAAALGVAASSPSERISALPAAIRDLLIDPVQRKAAYDLKTIDGLIAAGHGFPHLIDADALAARPQLWRHRIDSYVALYGETLRTRPANDSGLQSLDGLLARMPEADFQRAGPKLAAFIAAKPDHVCTTFSAKRTFARMHSIGVQAVPMFEAILKDGGKATCNEALETLCRMGAAGAVLAPLVQKIYQSTERAKGTDSRHFHAYVTLLAMGQKDRIVEDKPGYNAFIDRLYAQAREQILAGNLASGCSYSGSRA